MSRILLLLDNKENRRLLGEWLSVCYHEVCHQVLLPDSDAALDEPFDLCIFDGPALDRLWQRVCARKEREQPLFLPVLLATPRRDVGMVTRHMWRSVDDLIISPIERLELQARVEVLLRARHLSLELQSDLAARQRAEEQLRQSEEMLRLVLEHSPDNILYQDRDLRYIWIVNPVHFSQEMMLGKTDFDLVDREQAQLLTEVKRKVLETGAGTREQIRLVIGGEEYYFDAIFQPRLDTDGRVVGVFGYVRDITEQRRRERHRATLSRIGQALSQSLNSEAVLETAMDQILEVLGADTVDIHLADAERRELVLAGYRNLTPETVRMLQHVPYDGPFLTSRAFATGEIQVIEDTLQSSPELVGARMLTELENLRSILAVPLVTAGCPIGAMVLGTRSVRRFAADELETITQAAALFGTAIENARLYRESQHRAEELEEQRRRREEFVSVVVHELRAPLTVLGGYTQILRRQTAVDPERQRQALGVMAEQLQKLGGLVSELQDSARIEAGRFTVERAPMDLVDTARHVVEEQQATTTRHQVLIETPDGPIEGRWDRGRIAQALTNLVSNAIKYSPEGGEVRVVVHRKAGEAKVSVSDRGIGIGAEEVPLLFQPYSRLRRERRAGGVGLGLYITKGIVEAHGGRIWVVSERGQGSTFYFMLPLDGKVAGER